MTIALGDWPQLMPLVDQALSMPAGERGAWLARVELAPSIRTALLELLQDREAIESGDFLGALPQLGLPAPASTPLTEQFEAGLVIGAWRLLHEIGQGGMNTVWLAERADGQVTRQVALKIPHAGPGHRLLAVRLLRERNILAALEHPHIGRLYDVGVTQAGMPYLVMEFIAGHDILDHADAQGLRVAQRIALFQQVLSAVQYAHSRLILHRDLKPANILVDASGSAKLLDFGIAKALADDGSAREATELTSAAGRLLTPAYASPEQLLGQALSTASDVYSLGVVLHELLTGERPCGVSSNS
jgi:serine/threonine protein kinase